ncbi:MAG TPA: pirin family protein [Pseudomonadales bacterium]|nr:pirin family protein [Pseudomonadales bacterium]
MTSRQLHRIINSQATTDGAGVKIQRSLGAGPMLRHDPFLMLDEFYSDNPDDYIAGFPSHPHRGFETVTYMLDGHMRHEDHMGNRGDLGPGDVQWMTAARGIIHSEMPQQTEGRMRGFQLWINLPGAEKMKPASYCDIPSRDIPEVALESGGHVRIIAGTFSQDGVETAGPIRGLSTEPVYFDVVLPESGTFETSLASEHNAFIYLYEGTLTIGDDVVPERAAGVLTSGEQLTVTAGVDGAKFLLLAAKPIGEPVAQYGPFVMNSRDELEQALADYRDGRLTA